LINDEQDESKLDDVRQIPILPDDSNFLSDGKQGNDPECLSKNFLLNILSRNRRASISRPYFHHWRASRDNSRYASKNLLAFSPRLGRRAYEGENEFDMHLNKHQAEEENSSPDLDALLLTLVGHLQRKKIDIIYEDSNKICLSEPITDGLIKEILEKFDSNRRQQEEQEARERNSKSKHPLLFRYRLG
jgi:hypothetical protein